MDNIEIEFFEEYKKLDNLCKDLFRSNRGVTKYIEEMEKTPFIDRRLVNSWNNYYDMLKHVKWIRNNIAHNNEYSGCNKDDVENIKNFYQQIIEQKDPFSIINEKNKELQEYNEVNRMEEKTCYNAQLHSGSFRQTEEKYAKLRERRKVYKEFPFTKKEAKEITNLFIEEKISKEELAEKYCTTKPKIDKAIYVAIAENWIKDDQYMKIKESSLKIDSSEKTLGFFKQLDNLRASTKESS